MSFFRWVFWGFFGWVFYCQPWLKDAVREVKVRGSAADLGVGARVAAYWSAKYQFLHPGTVVPHESEGGSSGRNSSKYVNIELDDGDSREIHVDQVGFFYEIEVLVRCLWNRTYFPRSSGTHTLPSKSRPAKQNH